MDELSPRQREVLEYIQLCISKDQIPPTYREIGDALGISSTNGVADHVKALMKKGYISRPKEGSGRARALFLTPKSQLLPDDTIREVPVLGHVAAGTPIFAEEQHDESFQISRSFVDTNQPVFALRVKGESMIDEGMLHGDLILVRQSATARDGEIVVALVDGEVTVKFFFKERNRIRLQPAHPTMEPIFVENTQQASIQGVVIGLYRQY